jgi:mannose/fructose-specific phosphotransferase system component IIA
MGMFLDGQYQLQDRNNNITFVPNRKLRYHAGMIFPKLENFVKIDFFPDELQTTQLDPVIESQVDSAQIEFAQVDSLLF